MGNYIQLWKDLFKQVTSGPRIYFLWLTFLGIMILIGINGYLQQMEKGLIVTNMTDQVSWGAYIANFTYIVGLAAAAVMLVIPAYIYKIKAVKEIVFVGEFLAIAAVIMCLLFVMVDMGRPDRLWHIIPFIGKMNWPLSILSWDVIVLNVYLLLSLHIPSYLLYKKYMGEPPDDNYYKPFVYISIFWAISIHTVTAFLYCGLGGRPFWNTAILAPRFLASAFAVGPSLILLTLQIMQKTASFPVKDEAYVILKRITTVALIINLFLLGCEIFKEFYTDSAHSSSARYLFLGLDGHNLLVPYIWTAVAFNVIATLIFSIPELRENRGYLNMACVLAIVGIWIEKGMGLIIPGFIPSPLGDIVEYTPSLIEIQVCAGIWAVGAFLFTISLKTSIPIETGELRFGSLGHPQGSPTKFSHRSSEENLHWSSPKIPPIGF
ncbi:MAG: polysulfide reductase NrfD [Deltaproteobacteria bacterium]|nr:polysulfide reductase NrfD [Deltaproteobacteria bacterium]